MSVLIRHSPAIRATLVVLALGVLLAIVGASTKLSRLRRMMPAIPNLLPILTLRSELRTSLRVDRLLSDCAFRWNVGMFLSLQMPNFGKRSDYLLEIIMNWDFSWLLSTFHLNTCWLWHRVLFSRWPRSWFRLCWCIRERCSTRESIHVPVGFHGMKDPRSILQSCNLSTNFCILVIRASSSQMTSCRRSTWNELPSLTILCLLQFPATPWTISCSPSCPSCCSQFPATP